VVAGAAGRHAFSGSAGVASLGRALVWRTASPNPDRGYVAGRRIWQLDGLTASARVRALTAPTTGVVAAAPDGTPFSATGGEAGSRRLLRVTGASTVANVEDARYRAEALVGQ